MRHVGEGPSVTNRASFGTCSLQHSAVWLQQSRFSSLALTVSLRQPRFSSSRSIQQQPRFSSILAFSSSLARFQQQRTHSKCACAPVHDPVFLNTARMDRDLSVIARAPWYVLLENNCRTPAGAFNISKF